MEQNGEFRNKPTHYSQSIYNKGAMNIQKGIYKKEYTEGWFLLKPPKDLSLIYTVSFKNGARKTGQPHVKIETRLLFSTIHKH